MDLPVIELLLPLLLVAHLVTNMFIGCFQTALETGCIFGRSRFLRNGCAIHVNGHLHLAAEHQKKGGIPCRWVDTCVVGDA